MTKTEYAGYLQSSHWQKTRKQFLTDHGNECDKCGMPRWLVELVYDQDLHVHHKTYANKWKEKTEDLQALCCRCHEIETFGRSKFRKIQIQECSVCGMPHWDPRSDWCEVCRIVIPNGISLEQLSAGEPANLFYWISNNIAFYAGETHKELEPLLERIRELYTRGTKSERKI